MMIFADRAPDFLFCEYRVVHHFPPRDENRFDGRIDRVEVEAISREERLRRSSLRTDGKA